MRQPTALKHPMRRLLSNRRGLLAGAAALVGAGLSRLTGVDRAEATSGTPTTQGAMILGANASVGSSNLASTTTALFTDVGNAVQPGFRVVLMIGGSAASTRQTAGDAIQGHSGGVGNAGVFGYSSNSIGVLGQAEVSGGSYGVKGVVGQEGPGPFVATGVWGTGTNATGVAGTSTTRSGVFGISGSVGPGLGPSFGVHGTSASNVGTFGSSTSNYGVYGLSTNNVGVYGESTNSYGCGGATSKPGFAGLFGYAGVASAAGFLGVNGAPGGTAGYFHGAVTVDGPFQVVNGPKNALVAHPDGSHRRMYCQESPEPWFEDFGRGQVVAGKATVRLDQDFAAVVKNDDYFVFLTEAGDLGGLYVLTQGTTSFEVRARNQSATGGFQYRVVARRKDDVGRRMEKVDLPKFDLRPPAPPETPPGQDTRPPR